ACRLPRLCSPQAALQPPTRYRSSIPPESTSEAPNSLQVPLPSADPLLLGEGEGLVSCPTPPTGSVFAPPALSQRPQLPGRRLTPSGCEVAHLVVGVQHG